MRVIAGRFKGKTLYAPKSEKTRPTTDVVKEGIFCKLAEFVSDALVLDLFSGSGALGIESLSRNAKYVDFVDNNINGVILTKKNLQNVSKDLEKEKFNVFKCDCRSFLAHCDKVYDIIFLDPPYESGLYIKCLDYIFDKHLLSEDGIVVCEHKNNFVFEKHQDKIFCTKKYGNTSVSYLQY